MSDLTVLVSPTPFYPKRSPLGFNFARQSQTDLSRPVMVTLESVDADEDGPHSPIEVSHLDTAFLSPPRRTFKAVRHPPPPRPASAPLTAVLSTPESQSTPPIVDIPRHLFSSSTPIDRSELSRPPPPLFRPTTFWRRTKRSGVAGASYSPSSHLIRVTNWYKANQAVLPVEDTSNDHRQPYYAAEDTPSLTPLPTNPSDTNQNGATGDQNIVLPSDLPTPSLFQITALPPTTTSPQAVVPKLPYHAQLNVLYLTPLFIALGVVLGAITTIVLLRWRENRWRLRRTSTLLSGPPYAPPENDVEDRLLAHGYPSMEQVSLFAAVTPSKFTIHGSRYIPKRETTWQSGDTAQQTFTQISYAPTIIPSSDGETFTVVSEEDPFLATSPIVTGLSFESSSGVSVPQIRVSPSLDPTPGDISGSRKAQQNSLPRPFRRGMFDVLKLKGSYRQVPTTHKDTILVPEGVTVSKTSSSQVHRIDNAKTTAGRHRARISSLDGSIDINEDVHGLPGLQGEKLDSTDALVVLQKRPPGLKNGILSSPTHSEKRKTPRRVTPFASESKTSLNEVVPGEESKNPHSKDVLEKEQQPDIYTKAPHRRSRTPGKEVTAGPSRRSLASDTHASVLPLSPPSLMSPPLERSLFFTTPLSSSASLTSRMNVSASTHSSPSGYVHRSPELFLFPLPSVEAKQRLRSKRPESPLPYPPYPDDVHAQPTPRERLASVDVGWRSASPGSPKPKGRPTSAVHQENTTGVWSLGSLSPTALAIAMAASPSSDMLDRVNDIVAQGYIKKQTSTGGAND